MSLRSLEIAPLRLRRATDEAPELFLAAFSFHYTHAFARAAV